MNLILYCLYNLLKCIFEPYSEQVNTCAMMFFSVLWVFLGLTQSKKNVFLTVECWAVGPVYCTSPAKPQGPLQKCRWKGCKRCEEEMTTRRPCFLNTAWQPHIGTHGSGERKLKQVETGARRGKGSTGSHPKSGMLVTDNCRERWSPFSLRVWLLLGAVGGACSGGRSGGKVT